MTIPQIKIRAIQRSEWEDAMQLCWDTFLVYEAPDYTKEGIKSFRSFIRDPILKKMFLMGEYVALGAFVKEEMVGVIGARNVNHISLLFVETGHQHFGVATALVKEYVYSLKDRGVKEITVDSSPYAVGFYHKLGFVDLSREIFRGGIRYTPMKLGI